MNFRIVWLCAAVLVSGRAISQDKVPAKPAAKRLEFAATLQAVRSSTLSNPLQGQSRITSICVEGTEVKEGDVVCTVGAPRNREKVAMMRMSVDSTRKQIAASRTALAAAKRRADATRAEAERRLEIAEMALESWTKGESPLQRAEHEGAVRVSQAEFEYAKGLAAIAEESASRIDLLRAKMELAKTEANLQTAEFRLRYFREFVHPQRAAKLKLEKEQVAMQVAEAEADAVDAANSIDLDGKVKQLAAQEKLLEQAIKQRRALHRPCG